MSSIQNQICYHHHNIQVMSKKWHLMHRNQEERTQLRRLKMKLEQPDLQLSRSLPLRALLKLKERL